MDTIDTMVDLVLQMKVPWEIRHNESEIAKWRLEQAIRLARREIYCNIMNSRLGVFWPE